MRLLTSLLLSTLLLMVVPSAVEAYTVGPPSETSVEASERRAREAAEEQKKENEEAAKAAEEKKAAEERPQREAEERRDKEASEQKAKEEASRCAVPTLKGDSLARASEILRKSHCKLGKVTRAHGAKGTLVVVSQSSRSGARLSPGAAVSITLGSPKRRHR